MPPRLNAAAPVEVSWIVGTVALIDFGLSRTTTGLAGKVRKVGPARKEPRSFKLNRASWDAYRSRIRQLQRVDVIFWVECCNRVCGVLEAFWKWLCPALSLIPGCVMSLPSAGRSRASQQVLRFLGLRTLIGGILKWMAF